MENSMNTFTFQLCKKELNFLCCCCVAQGFFFNEIGMDLRKVSKSWSCGTLFSGDKWVLGQQQPSPGLLLPQDACLLKIPMERVL